jgi:multiple sugar transport system permease protein
MSRTRARNFVAAAIARHAALVLTSGIMILPFVWMVSLSLKPPDEIFSSTWRVWPSTFYGVENYRAALDAVPLLRYLLNGVLVCAAIFALQILVNLPCAYALAKLRFRGRSTLFAAVLVGLLIPPQVLAIPLFVLFYAVGILDTYAALVLPWTISVFGIFLMRQFFRTVPDELIQAARLDGLSEFSIVWKIMLPVVWPALVAFGIFSVVAHWNDLFWPLVVIQSSHLATPPLGVLHFLNEEAGSSYGPLMAGTVLITLPLMLAFLFAQRRFVDGIVMTGMK